MGLAHCPIEPGRTLEELVMTPRTFLGGRGTFAAYTAGALFAGWLAVEPGVARAYTISSAITTGCHEQITAEALRAVRLEMATAAAMPANKNERALVTDLEFIPPSDMRDLGGATLLVGVRHNDLKGRDSNDLSELAMVHGDPGTQREHCLRDPQQDEPGGSEIAILECRAFIRERVAQALEGLDATGMPDLDRRTSLSIYLSLRHRVDALLPTYYVRIGQAIHALEDSFTHTYRTPDGQQITAVLDWVEQANGQWDEATDGPPHATDLDRCDDADALRQRLRELATEAATAVLRATLDPTQTNDQKAAAVEAIMDKYLTFSPGCTFDNNWCEAPERQYGNGQGCNVAGAEPRPAVTISAAIAGLLMLMARARRRRAAARIGRTALLLAILVPSYAFAQPEPSEPSAPGPAIAAETHAPPPPVVTPVKEPGPKDPSESAWGAHVSGSGSFNYKGAAATLGARLRFSRHWTFGLDAEWNPWIAVNGNTALRMGAFNGYATVILRLPLAYEQFNLRSTANLGVSYLLIDLYGAPQGSTGIYAGLTPLGLEWKMSRLLFLIINPLNIAVPSPKLTGVPFSYPQYRATVGLEMYFG
jgi:hypothetical protein